MKISKQFLKILEFSSHVDITDILLAFEIYLLDLLKCTSAYPILKNIERARLLNFTTSPAVSAILRTLYINSDFHNKEFEGIVQMYVDIISGKKISNFVSPDATFRVIDGILLDTQKFDEILIDFELPHIWDHVDFENMVLSSINDINEQSVILNKLKEAKELVIQHNPLAWNFIKSFTKIVHFRSSNQAMPHGSSSNLLRNGATIIRGAGSDTVTAFNLAEFLLHEAIHHFVYIYEILEQEIVDLETGKRPTEQAVVSPWSGNVIAVDSFVHACFVWYGLYHFWQSNKLISTTLELQMLSAESGFLGKRNLCSMIEYHGIKLPDFYIRSIAEMQKNISNYWKVAYASI